MTVTRAPGGEITIAPLTFPSEGAAVQAIMYQPQKITDKLASVVVSAGMGRNIEGLEWLSQPLAQWGYVVLAQRYRDGDVRFHLRDVEDVRNAISYLEGVSYVDPRRIGIIGHSRGGSASLRATAKDSRVRSTVALSPLTDHAQWVRGLREHAPSLYSLVVRRCGGTPEEDPQYYQAVSAVNYAGQIETPVLFIHGTDDLEAPPEHSQWMYDALVKAGNPQVKIELLPSLGHAFEDSKGFQDTDKVVELVSQWFAETLKLLRPHNDYPGTKKSVVRKDGARTHDAGRFCR